jgi:16S rRNA G966 N2-methylase RsmD
VSYAVLQIESLRKIRDKAPAWFNTRLRFPALLSVEQASSERTALFKAGLFSGRNMADLSGGLGIDSWAFGSRFERVDYAEPDAARAAAAAHNFPLLDRQNIVVHTTDAETFLRRTTDTFDLLYMDPSRRDEQARRVFRLEDCMPNVLALHNVLFSRSNTVLLKAAPMLDISQALKQLQTVTAVWVVSVHGEVREVLYQLASEPGTVEHVPIEAVCLGAESVHFRFTLENERMAKTVFSLPAEWLYDPDAALLKAGALKSVAQQFGLSKLHANTHLYSSELPVDGFPGRRFRIEQVVRYDKKAVHAAVPDRRAHVAVRQFPDSAEDVRKRLGLKDGGDVYLFGVTLADEQKRMLVTRKA